MKIAYLSDSVIPSRAANSIHVMKMCQALADVGHQVTLIAPNRLGDAESFRGSSYEYYGVRENFELLKLPWWDIKGWRYIYAIRAAGSAVWSRADLVFGRDIRSCYFAALAGRRVVFESHSPIDNSGKASEYLFRRIIRKRNFEKLIVITNALKEYYRCRYPELNGKIEVAPDGADPMCGSVTPVELPNKGLRMQVGYVGHLYKGKGMEIISELAPICPWADFHVVGGTEEDLRYWKNRTAAVKNLAFHGFVPHERTRDYISAFDVVLLPNQESVGTYSGGRSDIGRWTSPLKAFEYMAAGKPIIASDLPVLREIFEHGKNALLASPQCVESWKHQLLELKQNQCLANYIARNAVHAFTFKYTWRQRAKKLI